MGIPVGTAVYDAVDSLCKSEQQQECEKLLENIRNIEAKLRTKRRQFHEDKGELYLNYYNVGSNPGKGGTFQGHLDQIIALNIGLDRAIQKAKDAGCL